MNRFKSLLLLLAFFSASSHASPLPVMMNKEMVAAKEKGQIKPVSSQIRFYSVKAKKAIKQTIVLVNGKTEYFTFQKCELVESNDQKTKLEGNLVPGDCENLSNVWFVNRAEVLNQINHEFESEIRTAIQIYAGDDDLLALPSLLVGGVSLYAAVFATVDSFRLPYALQRFAARVGGGGAAVLGMFLTYLAADLLTNRFYSVETNLNLVRKEYDWRVSEADAPIVFDLMSNSVAAATRKVEDSFLIL